jgi:hypothetical protein
VGRLQLGCHLRREFPIQFHVLVETYGPCDLTVGHESSLSWNNPAMRTTDLFPFCFRKQSHLWLRSPVPTLLRNFQCALQGFHFQTFMGMRWESRHRSAHFLRL